jgi:hypothetical protein
MRRISGGSSDCSSAAVMAALRGNGFVLASIRLAPTSPLHTHGPGKRMRGAVRGGSAALLRIKNAHRKQRRDPPMPRARCRLRFPFVATAKSQVSSNARMTSFHRSPSNSYPVPPFVFRKSSAFLFPDGDLAEWLRR